MMRFIALCFFFACASAGAAIMPASTSGNVTTYGASTMSAADIAAAAISRASDSSIQVQKNIDLVVEGRAAVVSGISKPLPVNYAKAVGNFARGVGGAALKTAGAVYAAAEIAKALNDLCNELGYSCYKGSDGQPVVKKTDPSICTVAPCYSYTRLVGGTNYQPSAALACQSLIGVNAYGTIYTGVASVIGEGTETAKCVMYHSSGSQNANLGSLARAPSPATYVPSSFTELEASIAAKSGWPSTSALPEAIKQAVASGETLPLPTPTVTGPSSIQGPQTSQTTPAQNGQPATTKTTNTVYNITYEGNKVTTNNVTTTVVNNGTTTTTTTETKEQPPDPSPSDTPNPDLPKLYERKYPDGLTGVWRDRKAELNSSPLLTLIQTMTPSITTSGGCPQFSIPAQVGPLTFGTGSFGPPCYIWDFCKVVVLLGAAFLARALIFGG